jgi:NAD(P)-dependent dehydrogenase (short-subunit alcohol dehydrogenase family)
MSLCSHDPPSVLITGASTGIGAAVAAELDRRQWRVFAGVRSEQAAHRLREEVSPRIIPVQLDVTERESIATATAQLEAQCLAGGLAGLVNNAGIAVGGPLELIPEADLRRQFDVNVLGLVAVTRAVLPMLRTGRGRIVNIGSVSGRIALPMLGAYSASKFALEALTDAMRVELGRWGIEVAVVEPGSVQTPIWEKAQVNASALEGTLSTESRALYADATAAMRQITVDEARTAMPVERVVRAVVHALTARRPRTRYPVDWRTRLWILWWNLTPDRLRDRMIRFGMRQVTRKAQRTAKERGDPTGA